MFIVRGAVVVILYIIARSQKVFTFTNLGPLLPPCFLCPCSEFHKDGVLYPSSRDQVCTILSTRINLHWTDIYSELPLIRTPEMWPPLYSGHSEKSQSMLYSMNSPLKCGHPSNQDTLTEPKGGRIRGRSL